MKNTFHQRDATGKLTHSKTQQGRLVILPGRGKHTHKYGCVHEV